jgi:uncharacterized phage protein gp47/JayE
MTFGVGLSGFVVKTYSQILEEKKTKAKELFGDDIDLTDTSPMLKLLQVQALEEQRLWEMAEAFYYSAYVDYATGESLDRVATLIGQTRNEASQAIGQVTFTGINGTVIPAGTVVQTTGDEVIKFTTDVLCTIAGGTATVNVTAVLPGANGNLAANTITQLETPIAGVASVTNASATLGGEDVEPDDEFRARCKGALISLARGTLEAIRLAVLEVSGVISVSAFEDLDIHKATLYVYGVTKPNTDVDDAIEETRPAGIPVDWYEVVQQNIYVDITVTVDSTKMPADAHDQIEDAIVNYIMGLGAGSDVIYTKIIDSVYDAEEDESDEWIEDITVLKVDTVSPPAGTTNVIIDVDEKAVTDTVKVVVTLVQV